MKDLDIRHLSFDEFDEARDPRPEPCDFDGVVERALSRRGFLGGAVAFGSGAAAMGLGGLLSSTSARAAVGSRFAFTPVDRQTDFTVHVPEGYSWRPVAKWGDPLFSDAPAFDHAAGGTTAAGQERAFGENTDGMELFTIDGRQVIAVNHEYVNLDVNLVRAAPEPSAAAPADPAPENAAQAGSAEFVPAGGEASEGATGSAADAETNATAETTAEAVPAAPPEPEEVVPETAEEVLKLQNAQGITVMEVAEGEDGWAIVLDSPFNRRITHNTPMRISGPAAGHGLLKTEADPTGTAVLGTFNNCGAGKTPWGTYLTCEENFNGYFGSTDPDFVLPEAFARYGIEAESVYAYEKFDPRFDFSKNPNEPNRHGYVVEIDPADPDSTPVKRSALGRFKHENAAVVLAPDGRVVVYLGDDERNEFLYKFVSTSPYVPGEDPASLLDQGQLYAARFYDNETGEWLALTPAATGMTSAEIAIHTRQAASAVGATTMDRPEWVATNPVAAEAYCALTNNSERGVAPNAGGDESLVGGPNPRPENQFGQIVRWYPAQQNHASEDFTWDLYVMAGNPEVHSGALAGSANVNSGNLFNSPDGMMFDSAGLLWIQTDGDDSNEGDFAGMGNNQMLVGDPVTGEIVRFLTGPNGSEVTGLTWSSDRRTMFVGIQHPGGSFPAGEGLPRSTVIAVWRDDGALVG